MILMEVRQLREWAYDSDSFVSMGQDFELWVADLQYEAVIIE